MQDSVLVVSHNMAPVLSGFSFDSFERSDLKYFIQKILLLHQLRVYLVSVLVVLLLVFIVVHLPDLRLSIIKINIQDLLFSRLIFWILKPILYNILRITHYKVL